MDFLIFLFLMATGLYFLNKLGKDSVRINKTACKLHTWKYDETGFLYCSTCNCRPGEIGSSYDKPY